MSEQRFILDTNMASHIIRGNAVTQRKLQSISMNQICVSSITEGELRFGAAKRGLPKLTTALNEFLLRVEILPWDSDEAQAYGELRAQLVRVGKPLGNLDTLIAAHALAVDCTLITNDQAFKQVPGLRVEDWTV